MFSSMEKIKVLKITPWYPTKLLPLGGSFVEDQAIALKKEGLDVGVLFVEMDLRGFYKKLGTHYFRKIYNEENGVKVFRYYGFFPPKINSFLYEKWTYFFEILLKKYIQKFGLPDIFHAHTYHGGYVAALLSKKYNIPYIITEHTSSLLEMEIQGWKRSILTQCFNNASEVIAVSSGLKNTLINYTKNNIKVIPNLIDTELFSLKKEPKDSSKIEFVAVGDLIPRKGFHFLIEGMAHVKPEIKTKIHLSILGHGAERKRLNHLIQKFGLHNEISLLGEIPRINVPKILKSSDVFILSSTFETFGIVIIEAMATGLPVICTKCFGPEDIVSPETGILIPSKSPKELTNAIELMYENYKKFNAKKIRNIVVEKYTEKVIAERLKSIYQSIVSLKML